MFSLRNILNLWRPFERIKPKTKGWYACTVEVHRTQRYVMNLFWNPISGRWKDNIRQNVFDSYKVYGYNEETKKEDKLLTTSGLCDRTVDVVAWKNIPKTYMKGFIKDTLHDEF